MFQIYRDYDPSGRAFRRCKEFGIEVASNPICKRDIDEAREQMMQAFVQMLLDRYEQLRTNPFLQNKVNKALNTVARRIRAHQKANNFQFSSDIHYGTPA